MARGRMLNKSISASRKFHLLPDDTCRLLATWILAHLDRNGVFYGDPVIVKSLIFPRRGDVSAEQIEMYLENMREIGLIILFESQGQIWQYWPGFADNQTNLRTDRETTDFPAPVVTQSSPLPQQSADVLSTPGSDGELMPEIIRHDAGDYPAQSPPNIIESNLKELLLPPPGGGSSDEVENDPDLSEVSTAYQANIGFISPMASDQLKDLLAEYGKEWVLEAMGIAVKSNKRKLTYIGGILRRWHTDGKGPPGGNGRDSPDEEVVTLEDINGEVSTITIKRQ